MPMLMVFKFRMLTDENDQFVRDYEILYDMNLLDFHKFICSDLKYDQENMASFFTSDDTWDKLREFTLFDVGEEVDPEDEYATVPMESVSVGQIIHKNNDRLIWLFDMFADRRMFLELTATEKTDSQDGFPRVVQSEGKAPGQFDAGAFMASDSIFEEAMAEFNDFEGDDSYDDQF